MVNFRLKNRLDFKKLLKKEANGHTTEMPLNVNVPQEKEQNELLRIGMKAVGYIVLIIGGVFLALLLFTTWNERDLTAIEQVYVQNFARDVDEDIKNLKNSIDINSSRILDVKEILNDLYRTPDSVELNNFTNRYISALYVSKFSPTHPTFNDFSSYSQQELLENHQLRNDIFRYYDKVNSALSTIENYETYHKETFVPKFNSEYIKGRALVIFKKYYEDIDEETDPDLTLWTISKDSKIFIEAENLLLQRLLFLDRSLEIEGELLDGAKELKEHLEKEMERF